MQSKEFFLIFASIFSLFCAFCGIYAPILDIFMEKIVTLNSKSSLTVLNNLNFS